MSLCEVWRKFSWSLQLHPFWDEGRYNFHYYIIWINFSIQFISFLRNKMNVLKENVMMMPRILARGVTQNCHSVTLNAFAVEDDNALFGFIEMFFECVSFFRPPPSSANPSAGIISKPEHARQAAHPHDESLPVEASVSKLLKVLRSLSAAENLGDTLTLPQFRGRLMQPERVAWLTSRITDKRSPFKLLRLFIYEDECQP